MAHFLARLLRALCFAEHAITQAEWRLKAALDCHERLENRSEICLFETDRSTQELSPFLRADQDTLIRQGASSRGSDIASRSTGAIDLQPDDVEKTLRQLGLGRSPNQTLEDWIFYGPSE